MSPPSATLQPSPILTNVAVPIYITAAILAVVVAFFSDKLGKRSPFIIGLLLIMACGFSMCIGTDPKAKPGVVYAGVYIAACAIYPAFPGVIAWLSNNVSGSLKRSVGMAIQIGVGNLGGVSLVVLLTPFVYFLLVRYPANHQNNELTTSP